MTSSTLSGTMSLSALQLSQLLTVLSPEILSAESLEAACARVVEHFPRYYRVSHVLVDLQVGLTCPAAQPLLPNSHQPRQNWADSGTLKIIVNPPKHMGRLLFKVSCQAFNNYNVQNSPIGISICLLPFAAALTPSRSASRSYSSSLSPTSSAAGSTRDEDGNSAMMLHYTVCRLATLAGHNQDGVKLTTKEYKVQPGKLTTTIIHLCSFFPPLQFMVMDSLGRQVEEKVL